MLSKTRYTAQRCRVDTTMVITKDGNTMERVTLQGPPGLYEQAVASANRKRKAKR